MASLQSSLPHDRLVWGALLAAMLLIGGRFLLDLRKASDPAGPVAEPLPVLGWVQPFRLTNQFGMPVTSEDLEGYVWVANVIFSRCPGQCHVLSGQMRRVQDGLDAGAPVRLVSLTADPEYDSPDVLERYGRLYGASPSHWHFLTGPKADVYGLAIESLLFSVVETDVQDRASVDDLFIHSTAFVVVDEQGRLRAVVQGEEPDAEERLLALVRQLVPAKPGNGRR